MRRELAGALAPAGPERPWGGRTLVAGWGAREPLAVALTVPELVVEISADTARDAAGRWRHPVRLLRVRPDLAPEEAPLPGE
ncbi:hypothetical protein [Streptomyces syringium]|uniref:hypothetical protein n=1 Tax=Streptomyces syringium TaxID=76729 RepID=UPI0033E00C3F